MSFIDHLDELRSHLIRASIALLLISIVSFIFIRKIFDKIIFGVLNPDFPLYKAACTLSKKIGIKEIFCYNAEEFAGVEFQNPIVQGQFIVAMKVAFITGLVIGFPYLFYELWRFIKPGLRKMEVKATRGIVFITSMLFSIGAMFGYFIIWPFGFWFFYRYSVSDQITNLYRIDNYMNLQTMIVLATGILFELPMFIYFLAKIGVVTPKLMRKYRKHSIIGILILSALITPADPLTQLIVSIPVYFLYEISIIIAARVYKNNEKAAAALN